MKIENGLQNMVQNGFKLAGETSEESEAGVTIYSNLSEKQGDTVAISAEGMQKSKDLAEESAGSDEGVSAEDPMIKKLKERIKQLQEEIEKLQDSNLPEKEKNAQIQAKQSEIALIQKELQKLQGNSSGIPAVGTSAEGMGNSLT